MTQHQLVLHTPDGRPIPAVWAYRLYAWLLTRMPREEGDWLHQTGEHPISQFLSYDKDTQQTVWTVNLPVSYTHLFVSRLRPWGGGPICLSREDIVHFPSMFGEYEMPTTGGHMGPPLRWGTDVVGGQILWRCCRL